MHSPEKFPHWVLFRALLVFSCTQEQVLPCSCIFVLCVFFPAAPGLDRQDRPCRDGHEAAERCEKCGADAARLRECGAGDVRNRECCVCRRL